MPSKVRAAWKASVVCTAGFAAAVVSAQVAPVPTTGQTTCWDAAGTAISCVGTGQDGDLRRGVQWPVPRFTDQGDGTVTDNLTALVWLKDGSCADLAGVDADGAGVWTTALSAAAALASGTCGLTDGSTAGSWRLPNVQELHSLLDYEFSSPALSNTAGTGRWAEGDPFHGFKEVLPYWSSTSDVENPSNAWFVGFDVGSVVNVSKIDQWVVWPVRGGGQIFADGFESGDQSAWSGGGTPTPAPAPATGQKTCWDAAGTVIPCAGSGQDGDLRSGVQWPVPRFTDNGDGTVTDDLTALIWLKDANCFGNKTWATALTDANTLASGACELTDASAAGDWRLPNVQELQSLIDYEFSSPAISNTAGTGPWTEGDPFSGVQLLFYWSSTSDANHPPNAWFVHLDIGSVVNATKTFTGPVWPVRAGILRTD